MPLPPVGEARAATLADGWPVWVVHHEGGAVSVISGVAAARTRSASTLFAGPAAIVLWLPAARRFVAGDVAYDDRGRVLGYASEEPCLDECPHAVAKAPDERDLDRYDTTLALDRVYIGARDPAPAHVLVSHWVPWDQPEHAARELDLGADALAPAVSTAIADAATRPIGSYAIVTGSIVQSTTDVPRLCADTPTCDDRAPRLLGVPAVPIDHATSHAHAATLLVRRDAAGLTLIATSPSGSRPSSTMRSPTCVQPQP